MSFGAKNAFKARFDEKWLKLHLFVFAFLSDYLGFTYKSTTTSDKINF